MKIACYFQTDGTYLIKKTVKYYENNGFKYLFSTKKEENQTSEIF
jgi:hypothetical protein